MELVDAVQLTWSNQLRLTSAAGPCEPMLGAAPERLWGLSLHEALGISRAQASGLHAAATQSAGTPRIEFLRGRIANQARWFRLAVGVREGSAAAGVQDLDWLLKGAPPLQIQRLSSSLSHELRNPLSSVKMAVQTLARNPELSERDQRRLVIANREVRTMERLLWLLSEYGRDAPPALDNVALKSLVHEAAALIEPELSERQIAVATAGDETARVSLDPGRLRPVLAQLFLNVAMGQAPSSSIEVRLAAGSDVCALSFDDPAAQLAEGERAALFEPFGSMLARAAGLSLATMHRVMQAHGGSIVAEAKTAGVAYTLTFPS